MDFGTNPDEDIALGAAYLAFLKTNPSMAQIRYKGLKSKDDHSDEELKIIESTGDLMKEQREA